MGFVGTNTQALKEAARSSARRCQKLQTKHLRDRLAKPVATFAQPDNFNFIRTTCLNLSFQAWASWHGAMLKAKASEGCESELVLGILGGKQFYVTLDTVNSSSCPELMLHNRVP